MAQKAAPVLSLWGGLQNGSRKRYGGKRKKVLCSTTPRQDLKNKAGPKTPEGGHISLPGSNASPQIKQQAVSGCTPRHTFLEVSSPESSQTCLGLLYEPVCMRLNAGLCCREKDMPANAEFVDSGMQKDCARRQKGASKTPSSQGSAARQMHSTGEPAWNQGSVILK